MLIRAKIRAFMNRQLAAGRRGRDLFAVGRILGHVLCFRMNPVEIFSVGVIFYRFNRNAAKERRRIRQEGLMYGNKQFWGNDRNFPVVEADETSFKQGIDMVREKPLHQVKKLPLLSFLGWLDALGNQHKANSKNLSLRRRAVADRNINGATTFRERNSSDGVVVGLPQLLMAKEFSPVVVDHILTLYDLPIMDLALLYLKEAKGGPRSAQERPAILKSRTRTPAAPP